MKLKDHINIALASNNDYAPYTAATIESIIYNNNSKNNINFYYLIPSDFSKENKNKILSLVNKTNLYKLTFVDMGNKFSDLKCQINHISIQTYYRLLLAEILKDETKCLYLDSDTIVERDISEFYCIDLDKNYIAGVKAACYHSPDGNKNYCQFLNIKSIDQYVNAGVLLMNLEEIRKDNITKKFIELTDKNFPSDQDIINSACYDKILLLPLKNNLMTKYFSGDKQANEDAKRVYGTEEIEDAKNSPLVIHYADKIKPWHNKNIFKADRFWFYINQTDYKKDVELPNIDIILPTYNRADKIKTAIKSIINQTYQDWILHIVNDGGEDISKIIDSFHDKRIKYYSIEHAGKPGALNYGLKNSKSPYIAYMDDDDVIFPNHLELLLAAALQNRKQFVYSDTYLTKINEDNNEVIIQEIENTEDVTYELLRYKNYINHKQILHTRKLYEQIGEYDTKLQILIDWDYIKRLAKVEEPYHVKTITGNHFLYFKNGNINSITGLWTKNPEKGAEALNIIFSKDKMILLNLFHGYHNAEIYKKEIQSLSKLRNEINHQIELLTLNNRELVNQIDEHKRIVKKYEKVFYYISSSKYFKIWRIYRKIIDYIKRK